jgi:tetratricopeptide (TPR) repeat protein
VNEAIEDANKAMEIGRGALEVPAMGDLRHFAGLQYSAAGNPTKALSIFQAQVQSSNVKDARGQLFELYRQIAALLIQMGDIGQADAYLRRSLALLQEARTSGFPTWRGTYARLGQAFETIVASHRALILEARGHRKIGVAEDSLSTGTTTLGPWRCSDLAAQT